MFILFIYTLWKNTGAILEFKPGTCNFVIKYEKDIYEVNIFLKHRTNLI